MYVLLLGSASCYGSTVKELPFVILQLHISSNDKATGLQSDGDAVPLSRPDSRAIRIFMF